MAKVLGLSSMPSALYPFSLSAAKMAAPVRRETSASVEVPPITTTILSLLTNTSIHSNVAMTGEMTLRGKVLAIGGLREKVIGAHRNGIRKIFIPTTNEKDLEEIPDDIKKEIDFILVDRYTDIYNHLFKKKRGRKKYDPRNIRLLVD